MYTLRKFRISKVFDAQVINEFMKREWLVPAVAARGALVDISVLFFADGRSSFDFYEKRAVSHGFWKAGA